ncbi:MAG: lipoyl domain-containing protein [Spirochaetia bacterium]|nr:lipoyl domain-containing protein [Spirochaetia bacterium]
MTKDIELKIPDVGQIGDIELIEWKIAIGDFFQEGDEICDLLTDKASFCLEAPEPGELLSQLVKNGQKVFSGQIVATVRVNLT